MGKVLLWLVIILGGLLLSRILAQHHAKNAQRPAIKPRPKAKRPSLQEPEPMVRCAHCSIHLPRSEALLSGGHTWCCIEHARLGPATRQPD